MKIDRNIGRLFSVVHNFMRLGDDSDSFHTDFTPPGGRMSTLDNFLRGSVEELI